VSQPAFKTANRRWPKAGLIAGLCAGLLVYSPLFAADLHEGDEVEAAFLYRFAGYVDWPPEALSGQDFTIAVLGSDSIVRELQRILPQHALKNRPAQVRRIRGLEELRDAQILFVGPQFNDELKTLIARVANRPVLVVTASERGLDDGSCVNFLLVDRRVRFEVSLTAADRVGLRVSSELLSVAVRVQGRSVHPGFSDTDADRSPKFAIASPRDDSR
jgi:YfiR/HmsC-like